MKREEVLRQLRDRTNQTWAGKRSSWAEFVEQQGAELDRLRAINAELLAALERINEWSCYATEEDIAARLLALHQIGQAARTAIAAAERSGT